MFEIQNANSAAQDTAMEDVQGDFFEFNAAGGEALMEMIMSDLQAWEREQNEGAVEINLLDSEPLVDESGNLVQFLADLEPDPAYDSVYARNLTNMDFLRIWIFYKNSVMNKAFFEKRLVEEQSFKVCTPSGEPVLANVERYPPLNSNRGFDSNFSTKFVNFTPDDFCNLTAKNFYKGGVIDPALFEKKLVEEQSFEIYAPNGEPAVNTIMPDLQALEHKGSERAFKRNLEGTHRL
jgi:hypothetical protein